MEQFKVTRPDDNLIISKQKFIVNKIVPIAIRIIDNHRFVILFLAGQDIDDGLILLQTMFSMNERDEKFIKANPLYMENLKHEPQKLRFYMEATNDATTKSLFVTDFAMTKMDKTFYFLATASQMVDKAVNLLELFIPKDNFIKLNLFFRRLSIYDSLAEGVFVDRKLNNVEFVSLYDINLDASTTDFISRIVCNHYSCKNGNKHYKFNFISPKIPDKSLKKFMGVDKYNDLYLDDFTIADMIFSDEKLYVIYEERSEINNAYKQTLALILDKNLYDKTNLIDFSKIYDMNEKSKEQ